MVMRYLKAQLMVLLCGGLTGPTFLAVYFGLGAMARPTLNWMFWLGLLVTAADVLVALALTAYGSEAASPARTSTPALTVSQRLRELNALHATGVVTDEEYVAKRRAILDQF